MVFTQRYERTVDRDNTVRFHNLVMQLERAHWRPTLAGCKAIIHQHLDTTLTLMIAGHRIGHYSAEGKLLTPLSKKQIKAVEKTLRWKSQKADFPTPLANPAHYAGFALSHRLYDDYLTYETGHFICSQKRTFLLANDTSEPMLGRRSIRVLRPDHGREAERAGGRRGSVIKSACDEFCRHEFFARFGRASVSDLSSGVKLSVPAFWTAKGSCSFLS